MRKILFDFMGLFQTKRNTTKRYFFYIVFIFLPFAAFAQTSTTEPIVENKNVDSIKSTSEESSENYVSSMKKEGVGAEYNRHMFIDPDLSKTVNKYSNKLWINDWIKLGFYLRPRYESRNNLNFDKSNHAYTDRILQTSAFYFLIDPSPYVTFKITVQDTRVWGGESPANVGDIRSGFFSNTPTLSSDPNVPGRPNNSIASNNTNIREAFVMIKKLPLDAKVQVGRQVWAYGDQRMIGGANWTINGLSFDGARIMFDYEKVNVHFFAARPYWTQSGVNGVLSSNDPKLNSTPGNTNPSASQSDTTLFGTYNSFKILNEIVLDVYNIDVVKKWIPQTVPPSSADDVLAQNRKRQNDMLYTTGFRLTNRTNKNNLPQGKAWDWTIESAWQNGYNGQRIHQRYLGYDLPATTEDGIPLANSRTERVKYSGRFHVFQTGYTFAEKLRVGAQYTYASGDNNRADGSVSTFQTLVNPRFGVIPYWNNVAGLSENIDTKNLSSWNANVTYKSEKWGMFQIAYIINDKVQKNDAWYAINGGANSIAGSALSSPVAVSTNAAGGTTSAGSTENYTGNSLTQSYTTGRNIYNELDLTWMFQINDNVSVWTGAGFLVAGNSVRNYRNSPLLYNGTTNQFELNVAAFAKQHTSANSANVYFFQVNAAL
ncbi:alginate export [Leptospira alstonii serovar Pingchang str. 80-412]|uniref:PF13372 domain protein n=3 Tax=Leptospira alstonii TaxID=28452 RepID=M6D237_9LEPT|nr:alginate export family protein [Leptospira alstonii]EMJ98212.1 PF13372 domain protein [Leptospira alstonii serovar Sichuan str. 79601]EQA80981.1 alginate export [Leptospira alstonii serovar Pingchang str. 80-412]